MVKTSELVGKLQQEFREFHQVIAERKADLRSSIKDVCKRLRDLTNTVFADMGVSVLLLKRTCAEKLSVDDYKYRFQVNGDQSSLERQAVEDLEDKLFSADMLLAFLANIAVVHDGIVDSETFGDLLDGFKEVK